MSENLGNEPANLGSEPGKGSEVDSREKLVSMPYHNGEKQAKLMGMEFEQAITDELHIDEPDTIRNELEDNGHLVPEPDSREKLEADVRAAYYCLSDHELDPVFAWLDRQAAIIRLECAEEYRTRLSELHGLLDEAASERELLRAELTEYKHSHPDAPNQPISQSDEPKSEETAGIHAAKCDIRDFDADSREKLEADLEDAIAELAAAEWVAGSEDEMHSGHDYSVFFDLLDRQRAITASEATRIYENGCEACRAAQKWRIAELKRQIDELAADLNTAEGDNEYLRRQLECAQGVNERQDLDYIDLRRENVALAHDLGECMAERDELHDKLKQIRSLIDEE
jgi:hypothetical protein